MKIKTNVIKPTSSKVINLYTDGASRGNGQSVHTISAYAYCLKWHELEKVDGKAIKDKTNNQMEIMAVIEGLKAIKQNNIPVVVYSDSALVVNCFNNGWWKKWQAQGWNKKGGLKNAELWQEMILETQRFKFITFKKVKGHANNYYNNLVDAKCNELMDNMQEKTNGKHTSM